MSNIVSASSEAGQKLLWFTFRQNNSGGDWKIDANFAHYISIQGISLDDALKNIREEMEHHNLHSCSCCGDRWSLDYPEQGVVPIYYEMALYEVLQQYDPDKEARLHRADGSIFTLTKDGIKDNLKLFEEIKGTA